MVAKQCGRGLVHENESKDSVSKHSTADTLYSRDLCAPVLQGCGIMIGGEEGGVEVEREEEEEGGGNGERGRGR